MSAIRCKLILCSGDVAAKAQALAQLAPVLSDEQMQQAAEALDVAAQELGKASDQLTS